MLFVAKSRTQKDIGYQKKQVKLNHSLHVFLSREKAGRSKGQLISKANFQAVDSPKKRTNGV